ncbi:hypothetical protein WJX74_002226 [Apatococcus lobatus]|uniref:Uncharacterized protein n=1 Tax=Apatococcus lobatus TaxID=904363 RepID=A0AAW1Q919_9CHLO
MALPALLLLGLTGSSWCLQLPNGGYSAEAGPNAATFPGYNIPIGQPLPQLKVLRDNVEFHVTATQITGPGDNSSADNPYVLYTTRTLNDTPVAGVLRVRQGESLRVRVCNDLDGEAFTLDEDQTASYAVRQGPSIDAGNNYKTDPQIYANHLHGFYGNPGTNNTVCSYTDPNPDIPCSRGDNIFQDILPGGCHDYQYDIPAVHAPGTLWMHPHHHGSASIQTQTLSVPAIVEQNPAGGFDYYNTPSCIPLKKYYDADNEIILHMQTVMLAINLDGGGDPEDTTGPTDDAYVFISTTMLPQDPYCCAGPDEDDEEDAPEGQTTWAKVGNPEGTSNETGPSISTQPFYTSGANAQFTIINGAYQPTIQMTANRAYRWRMLMAATMKVMDLSIAEPGCQMGLSSRDGAPLYHIPRNTEHVSLVAANRAEMFISCQPGNYSLRTGAGPIYQDPLCEGTHCELLVQDIVATIVVTEDGDTRAPETGNLFGQNCQPVYPPYLQSLIKSPASNRDTMVARHGLFNFTAPDPENVPESAACSINGALFTQMPVMFEEIGAVHELDLWNINVHSYHHHIQPFEITSLGQLGTDYVVDNGTWQVGDWPDVLQRFDNVSHAVVRWRPGPYSIVGTGYSVVHCHILPHNDEGCMLVYQLVQSTPANQVYPPGRSQGYKAGVTLACIIALGIIIAGSIFLVKRRKARKARQQALAAPLVVGGIDADPESQTASGSGSSEDSLANAKKGNANKVHHT